MRKGQRKSEDAFHELLKLRDDVLSGRAHEKTPLENLDMFQSLIEDTNDIFYVADAEGRLIYVSPQIERLRIDRVEILEKGVEPFIEPEDRDRVMDDFGRTMETGEEFLTEFRLVGSDGRARWLEDFGTTLRGEGGEILGLMGVLRDISDRKDAEREIRERLDRYRAVVEGQTELICRVTPDRRITFVNRAFCRCFEMKSEELLGADFMRFVQPEDGARLHRYLEDLGPHAQTGTIEHRVVTPRGPRWQRWTSRCIFDEDGRLVEIQSVGRDITKRKEAEEKSGQLQMKLMHARKMEAVGTLAGGVAHDFNNLLMGILGNLSVLLLDTPEDHPSYDMLRSIQDCVESGTNLTRQLLGFARSGKLDVQPVCVNDFTEHCLALFGRSQGKVDVVCRLHDAPSTIEVDRVQMEQVLLNLLFNGVHAMPDGGMLTLSTDGVSLDREAAAPLGLEPGPYAVITVEDTGIGMDEATRERIFEPFYTTKEMGRGTGLGLASVYGIVHNHGGGIDVWSRPGQGSRFAVYLPASERTAERGWRGSEELQEGRGETILVVDDEENVLKATKTMLEKLGYKVRTAAGTAEAAALYLDQGHEVDLVILDLVMPNGGGEAVYEALVKADPDVRIIFASGYSVSRAASDFLSRRFSGFLKKPFTLEELSRKLRDMLERG